MFLRLKDLLIPHEGNNFRPNLLERVSVGIMLVLILLSFAMANIQALFWLGSDWLVSTVLPAVIVELTNDERGTESLTALHRNATLDAAAKLKAEDMAKNEYFAHYSPDGVSPWHWFDEAGYDYLNAGENLAVHFTESDEVVAAWMNSPSHRANIMNGAYTDIGIGTAKGEYKGSPTVFVVQLFGTPRAKTSAPSTVAGASIETAPLPITIEKVAVSDTPSDVAPATVREEEQNIPQQEVSPTTTETSSQTENARIVAESGFVATTRAGEPGSGEVRDQAPTENVSIPVQSATQSGLWLEALYVLLAFFVVGALTVSLAVEWHRHHPVQIAYASGLLVVMALLLYVHEILTGQVLIV